MLTERYQSEVVEVLMAGLRRVGDTPALGKSGGILFLINLN